MGFDICITLNLMMCPETGKPFAYGSDPVTGQFTKLYDFSNLVVPEHLRPYLSGRGHLFHAYTDHLQHDNPGLEVDLQEFLEFYPSWEDVQTHSSYDKEDDYWQEEDHTKFKELLEWCAKSPYNFNVCWSY